MTARVDVDPQRCELHGMCVQLSAELFEQVDDEPARAVRPELTTDEDFALAEEAEMLCPARAINVIQS